MVVDLRPSEQKAITYLRVNHMEVMSGLDRSYGKIEVCETDSGGFAPPEAGDLDGLSGSCLSGYRLYPTLLAK